MSLIIIYYWAGASSIMKIDNGIASGPSFGHIALKIIANEEFPEIYEYISFWPGNCQRQNQHRRDVYLCKENTSHFHTKDQDDLVYKDRLPETVILTSLDANSIIESYERFRQSNFMWSTFGSSPFANQERRNCVGLSLALLNDGGFQSIVQTYYHLGIITGSISSFIPMVIIEFFVCYYKLILMMMVRMKSKEVDISDFTQVRSLVIFDSSLLFLSIYVGTLLNLKNLFATRYIGDHEKVAWANLFGALFGNTICAWLYYKRYHIFEDLNRGDIVLVELLFSREHAHAIMLAPFIMLFSSVSGAWIAGKLATFTLSIRSSTFNPGYFSGVMSSLLASLTTEIMRMSFLAFLRTFYIICIPPTERPSSFIKEIQQLPVYAYIGSSITAGLLAGYFIRRSLNYMVNDSIVTPQRLYEKALYFQHVEKENKPPIKVSYQKSPEKYSFFETLNDNKGKVLLYSSASAALVVIGLWAFKKKEFGVSSITNLFSLNKSF